MNVLLSLGNDLASSVAVRYLSQQAAKVSMNIQPLHIEEEKKHFSLGTGWVKDTWRDTVVSSSQDEINNFIRNEIRFCRSLSSAITRIGKREKQTVKEIQNGNYQLYAMGMLSSSSTKNFYSLLKDGLMEQVSCPILLIKNLCDFNSVTFLCRDGLNIKKMIRDYLQLYAKADVELHLVHIEPGAKETDLVRSEEVPDYLRGAAKTLEAGGCAPATLSTLRGEPQQIAGTLKDQGMIVSVFDKDRDRQDSFFDILAHVPTVVLLFWA